MPAAGPSDYTVMTFWPLCAAQTNVLERRMFVIPSFRIYGSCAGFYDYGPPGCAVKQNITQAWRQHFVLEEGMLEVCVLAICTATWGMHACPDEQQPSRMQAYEREPSLLCSNPGFQPLAHGAIQPMAALQGACMRRVLHCCSWALNRMPRSSSRDGGPEGKHACVSAQLECPAVTPEAVLKASGHVDRFTDYMVTDAQTGAWHMLP